MSIVVIGSVFVDIKGYPDGTFIPGGRNAGHIEQVYGGVGRNIVEDIANLELRPTFIGLVDESSMGKDIISRFDRRNINTRFMRATPDGLGTWLAVFQNSGDVYASISKRPDLKPIADILKEHGDEIFETADSVTVELDMEAVTIRKTLELAKKHGIPVFSSVSNMSIAIKHRDFLRELDCFVCNLEEAGICFSEDYRLLTPGLMLESLKKSIRAAGIRRMVVTMGGQGAVYASLDGEAGICPAKPVDVTDTTGAGDAFFAGVTAGLTYGKSLGKACEIGSRLSAAVIATTVNICPRFQPEEFGLDISSMK